MTLTWSEKVFDRVAQYSIRQLLTATLLIAALCAVAVSEPLLRVMVPYFAAGVILHHWPALIAACPAIYFSKRKYATAAMTILLIPIMATLSGFFVPWFVVPSHIEFWVNGIFIGIPSSAASKSIIRYRDIESTETPQSPSRDVRVSSSATGATGEPGGGCASERPRRLS